MFIYGDVCCFRSAVSVGLYKNESSPPLLSPSGYCKFDKRLRVRLEFTEQVLDTGKELRCLA